jgi:hypothetical protein
MLSTPIIFLPILLQGLIMAIDEFYFHRKRGLGTWEKIGHPLDTLTLLAAIIIAAFTPYAPATFIVFLGLSIFSCLFVTKDEFVHSREAPPFENWLHSLLFLLHPVLLLSIHELWVRGQSNLLQYLALAVLAFATYQALYWNFFRRKPYDLAASKQ